MWYDDVALSTGYIGTRQNGPAIHEYNLRGYGIFLMPTASSPPRHPLPRAHRHRQPSDTLPFVLKTHAPDAQLRKIRMNLYFLCWDCVCWKTDCVELQNVGRSEVYAWPHSLIWKGMCTVPSGDYVDVLALYEPQGSIGAVRRIGHRFFSKSDGMYRALAYDPSRDYLFLVWQNGDRFRHHIMHGTPKDFLGRQERESELSGVDLNIEVAHVTADGSGLYLLSKLGRLFRVSTGDFRTEAVLACSGPITAITASGQDAGLLPSPFAIVEDHTKVFRVCFHPGEQP